MSLNYSILSKLKLLGFIIQQTRSMKSCSAQRKETHRSSKDDEDVGIQFEEIIPLAELFTEHPTDVSFRQLGEWQAATHVDSIVS